MLILKVSFAIYHHIKDSFSIASQRDAEDFVTSAVSLYGEDKFSH